MEETNFLDCFVGKEAEVEAEIATGRGESYTVTMRKINATMVFNVMGFCMNYMMECCCTQNEVNPVISIQK